LHRLSYYWPTMITDTVQYAIQCKTYQIHADFIHQPPELLHPTIVSWPFEAWRIDVIRPISPPLVQGHRFILAITDYFLKWAEAIPLAEVKTTNFINFIKNFSHPSIWCPQEDHSRQCFPICKPIIPSILR